MLDPQKKTMLYIWVDRDDDGDGGDGGDDGDGGDGGGHDS